MTTGTQVLLYSCRYATGLATATSLARGRGHEMKIMMLRCSVAAALVAAATSCSNFFMDSDPYKISVRTMDLGEGQFDLVVEPRSANNSLGFVSFVPAEAGVVLETFSTGGLNEAGLSCDLQTLTNSKFPAKQPGGVNVASEKFCAWVLSSHSTVNETRAALQTVTVYQGIAGNCHFAIRGASIARPSRSAACERKPAMLAPSS